MKENEVLAPQYYRHTLLSENDLKYVNEECKRAYTTYSCKLNRRASMDTALRAFLIADKGFSIERAMVLDDISNEDYMNYFKEYISKYHNPEKSVEDNLKALGGMHERLYEKLQDFQIPDFGGELKTRDQLMEQERVLHGLKNFMIDMGQDYEKLDSGKTEPDKRRMYMSGMKDTAKFEQNRAKAVIYNQYVLSNMTYINSPNYGRDGECLALDFLKDFHKQYGGKKVSEISNTEVINVNVVNGTAIWGFFGMQEQGLSYMARKNSGLSFWNFEYKQSARLQAIKTVRAMGKADARYLYAMKGIGKASLGISAVMSICSFTESAKSDRPDKGARMVKAGLDLVFAGVGAYCGPWGWGISGAYFLADACGVVNWALGIKKE